MHLPVDALCPFCAPDSSRVFLKLRHAFALWDGFPVTDGHALIVPYRHVPSWFDASDTERAELFSGLDPVSAIIREQHGPIDGFNFGINSGTAAGQTVPHLHLHVIPRRHGDMPDPRGGVRHVIPGKGNYLRGIPPPPIEGAADEDIDAFRRFEALREAVLTTGESNPVFPHLTTDLAHAKRVDIAVAFVMPSGVERLYAHFDELLKRGGSLRLVTGDYLGVSDPDALQRLLALQAQHGGARVELRIFESASPPSPKLLGRGAGGEGALNTGPTQAISFHPKAYLLTRDYGPAVAYIGSSNLSWSALNDGVEWNHRIPSRDLAALANVRAAFNALLRHPKVGELDSAWLDAYRKRRPALIIECHAGDTAVEPVQQKAEPNEVQAEALEALKLSRNDGARAGLVVLATGLGKTWLAAFDVEAFEAKRVLFVAHREEILDQALATFRRAPIPTLLPRTDSSLLRRSVQPSYLEQWLRRDHTGQPESHLPPGDHRPRRHEPTIPIQEPLPILRSVPVAKSEPNPPRQQARSLDQRARATRRANAPFRACREEARRGAGGILVLRTGKL